MDLTPYNQKMYIKNLILQRKAFKKQLTFFQSVLDVADKTISLNVIQNLLHDLEEEYMIFKTSQSKLDDIDDGRSMQERIDLKSAFNICKGHAQDLIEIIKMDRTQLPCLKEEEISADNILRSKWSFPDEVENVRCHSPIIYDERGNMRSPDQEAYDIFKSEIVAQSSMTEQSMAKMNLDQNTPTSNTVPSTTLSASFKTDYAKAKNEPLKDDLLTQVLQCLEKLLLQYCVYARVYNL